MNFTRQVVLIDKLSDPQLRTFLQARDAFLAAGGSSTAPAAAVADEAGRIVEAMFYKDKAGQNVVARVCVAADGAPQPVKWLMHTYTTETIEGELPSNRYGTFEAIRERFGDKVKIVDAPPAEVESKDFCPYWPGFARRLRALTATVPRTRAEGAFKPRPLTFKESAAREQAAHPVLKIRRHCMDATAEPLAPFAGCGYSLTSRSSTTASGSSWCA